MSEQILIAIAWPYASARIHTGNVTGSHLPGDICAIPRVDEVHYDALSYGVQRICLSKRWRHHRVFKDDTGHDTH